MSIASLLLARASRLPPRLSGAVRTRDIRVPVAPGITLETEHYAPKLRGKHPTLLMRVPYGLRGFATLAECYAERGYHVVLQACRGTSRSDGDFDPLINERDDGLATLAWLKQQAWYDGRIGLTGPSYLGYAQWAISDALPETSAMSTKVTSAEFRSIVFPGGGVNLGLALGWMQVIEALRGDPVAFGQSALSGRIERNTLRAASKLPLLDADKRAVGHEVRFWRRWMTEAVGNDAFWEPLDHTHRITARTPPNHFISGWYDFMVDQLLRDYEALVLAGHTPHLTVGPWVHVSPELQRESVTETLRWMDAHLLGKHGRLRESPVRLFVGGINVWCDFDSYPPGVPDTQIWHIHPGKVLSQRPVHASPPDTYRYDPADPTPSVGGAMFAFTGVGPVDQSRLESRADVLTYSTEPLFTAITVIGNVRVTLYARASLPNADFFVRLSDVDEQGVSRNICDGFIRVTSGSPAMPEDIWKIGLKLHATAHTFMRGHRIRLLVASGAHPRYARNTGTDEPFSTAEALAPVDVEIFHDPDHPTTVHLPAFEI